MKNNNEYIFRLWAAVAVLSITILFLFIASQRLSNISTVDRFIKMNIGKNIHSLEYFQSVK